MLSKLTQRSLYAGYRSLNKLEECIQHKGHAKDIEQYCSEFYRNIPHNTTPVLTIETIKIKKQEILSMIQINAQAEVEEAFRKQNK
uniref:PARP alpha-helical domain-containing protein n=1 Tax=viral metagenome TaxID=1070528 RepID=A0A6C0JKP6_9ZZZZ